ncbi:MAG: phosphatidylglycerophosphatase A [PS1 clade bacterium]|jgi:phosphatidylglycerophosphatase A|uniref:Phosphatidylglycerophosphatase A n=1 Tax=PS1 clade bacterium TaxID=2175152 RepID=A0A368DXU1_9PROT|nr:MAG: phosphatidylglycerophosphatase A [PS1 clade bacterium]HAK99111.1 phosphatidylglycerophosphatase A [Rhodobiaceae bacterium]HCV48910.1 phosphatidylglycerophosphatase A [Rhodobiaceae bacterium]|tara:strand:+ start:13486 stop:13980 length:495 start_codon:yes stop_codon:yes gene_type:complete
MLKLHSPPEQLSIFSPVTLLASFGGSGFISPASGTWGSLAALPLASYILFNYSSLYLLCLSFALFVAGVWACREWLIAVEGQDNDPSMIVIDEAAGLSLALAFAEMSLFSVFLGFALFRLFDIAKPWPVSWLEKRFTGAFGIMIDDMAAGLIAGILLFFIQTYG